MLYVQPRARRDLRDIPVVLDESWSARPRVPWGRGRFAAPFGLRLWGMAVSPARLRPTLCLGVLRGGGCWLVPRGRFVRASRSTRISGQTPRFEDFASRLVLGVL